MAKKTPPEKRIGPNIKRLREDAGITQLDLAHKLGFVGPEAGAYISRVESGLVEPRVSTLSRIAKALGASMDDLLHASTPKK
jgi:transcriptional regulator with XRE-family HTH domain